jgi:hypothetical protein
MLLQVVKFNSGFRFPCDADEAPDTKVFEQIGMTIKTFGFGHLEQLRDNVIELRLHEGITVTKDMCDEIHTFLDHHLDSKVGLLTDTWSRYSHTYHSLRLFGNSHWVKAVAVVARDETTQKQARYLKIFPVKARPELLLEVFDEREAAIDWLQNSM